MFLTLKSKEPVTHGEVLIILQPAQFVVKFTMVRLGLEHTQGWANTKLTSGATLPPIAWPCTYRKNTMNIWETQQLSPSQSTKLVPRQWRDRSERLARLSILTPTTLLMAVLSSSDQQSRDLPMQTSSWTMMTGETDQGGLDQSWALQFLKHLLGLTKVPFRDSSLYIILDFNSNCH